MAVDLPEGTTPVSVSFVAPSTGDNAVGNIQAQGGKLQLQPFEVAVVSVR